MTDWEVEALNEGEAFFSVETYIFLSFSHSYIHFFGLPPPPPPVNPLNTLLGEGKKLPFCLIVLKVFISPCNNKRLNYCLITFNRQICADLISFLDIADNF